MDERRAALLVAGVALVVIGVVTTTLARGAVLGLASVTVGLLLAVSAGTRSIAAARARPARSSASIVSARQRAVPGVSFWKWSNGASWGTTPWGIGARVMAIAVVAGVMALVPDLSADVPPWSGVAAVLLFNTLLFVPPWAIERLTKPSHILPRSLDLAIVVPAAGVWLAAAVALAVGAGREWMLAAAVILSIGGIAVGWLLTRRESAVHHRARESS